MAIDIKIWRSLCAILLIAMGMIFWAISRAWMKKQAEEKNAIKIVAAIALVILGTASVICGIEIGKM